MTVFETHRFFPFSAHLVYQAFANPLSLARWWGPEGFSNTIESFDFRPSGVWRFTMHGPGDSHYPNEIHFERLLENQLLVLKHVSEPVFSLTIQLEPMKEGEREGTKVTWQQAFESDEVAATLKPMVVPANEQNLNRWLKELSKA